MKLSLYMKRKAARKAKRVKVDLRGAISEMQLEMKKGDIPYTYRAIENLRVKELTGYLGYLISTARSEMKNCS